MIFPRLNGCFEVPGKQKSDGASQHVGPLDDFFWEGSKAFATSATIYLEISIC